VILMTRHDIVSFIETDCACKKTATASSEASNPAYLAFDGDDQTQWSSHFTDNEHLTVDLGETTTITGLQILWGNAYAARYRIDTSEDGESFQTIVSGKSGCQNAGFKKKLSIRVRNKFHGGVL
jgi:mannan endo-1,4-beta-mannosidase